MPLTHSPKSIEELNLVSQQRQTKKRLDGTIKRLKKAGYSDEQIDLIMYRTTGLPKTFREGRARKGKSELAPS